MLRHPLSRAKLPRGEGSRPSPLRCQRPEVAQTFEVTKPFPPFERPHGVGASGRRVSACGRPQNGFRMPRHPLSRAKLPRGGESRPIPPRCQRREVAQTVGMTKLFPPFERPQVRAAARCWRASSCYRRSAPAPQTRKKPQPSTRTAAFWRTGEASWWALRSVPRSAPQSLQARLPRRRKPRR